MIGDVSRLKFNELGDPTNDLDLSALLAVVAPDQRRQSVKQDHGLDGALDWSFLSDAVTAATNGSSFHFATDVRNVNRAVGTLTGSAVTRALGLRTLRDDQIQIDLRGSAGQSLGAGCSPRKIAALRVANSCPGRRRR